MRIEKLRARALQSFVDAIAFLDGNGFIVDANRSLLETWGYEGTEDIIGRRASALFMLPGEARAMEESLLRHGEWVGEVIARKKDGALFATRLSATLERGGKKGPGCGMILAIDAARHGSRREIFSSHSNYYLTLFEKSPVSLWEADLSLLKKHIDGLRAAGTTDLRSYLSDRPSEACRCADLVRIIDVNEYSLELYGAESKAQLKASFHHIFSDGCWAGLRAIVCALVDGLARFEMETTNRTLSGKTIHVALKWSTAPGCEESWKRSFVSLVDITKSKLREDELRDLSNRDWLTGLLNRRGFLALAENELAAAFDRNAGVVLLVADLDNLKWTNDSLGHLEGDGALKEAAEVLEESFPAPCVTGRIGGDEFAVLLPDASGGGGQACLELLADQVEFHNTRPGRRYRLSLSAGAACASRDRPSSLGELLLRADRLMYEHKRRKARPYGRARGPAKPRARTLPFEDRRRELRHSVRDLEVVCAAEGRPSAAHDAGCAEPLPLLDLGLGGAGFLSAEHYEMGTPVSARILGAFQAEPVTLDAEVVWCQQASSQTGYRVGLKFLSEVEGGPERQIEGLRAAISQHASR